jgi:MFS family permease
VETPIEAEGGAAFSLRRHPPFAAFWAMRAASTVAYEMQAVAIGWQVYDLTGSALALGLIGLAQFVPGFAFGLFAGHIADRFDRRRVVRFCQTIEASVLALLAVGSAASALTIPGILAAVFVLGVVRATEATTIHALLPQLVTAAFIPRAAAGSASANQTAIILGPALGGIAYGSGASTAYALSAAMFITASLLAARIRIALPPPAREKPSLHSLLSGLAFIRARPEILGAISLDLVAVLLGGATALLPIYARDILVTGPWGLGLLRSAPAVGALSASLFLTRHALGGRVGRIMFGAVIAFGLATIAFAVSTSFVLSLAVLALLGASDAVSVVIRFSLVQVETPDALRGRVSAINSMFIGASNTLGAFESGVTAAWFGTVPAVLLGGIGTIVVALLWMRIFPALLRVDRLEKLPGTRDGVKRA